MNVSNNKVVSLTYELKVNSPEGDIIEQVNEDRPLTFVFGLGQMLPKFEGNIEGLSAKDDFQFELKCEEAYGPVSDDQIIAFPKDMFAADGEIRDDLLQIGAAIPMQDKEGNRFSGLVKAIGENEVTLDFNHPLAGDNLFFKGKIVDIREATEADLAPAGGCGSGGCGCDSNKEKEGCCNDGENNGGCGC